jgi:hypothetical protein
MKNVGTLLIVTLELENLIEHNFCVFSLDLPADARGYRYCATN